MRLFLAVFPPAEAQMAAARAAAAFRQQGDDIAWVRREQLHHTLRFIGEATALEARAAAGAASEAVKTIAPFGVALGGFAAFPSARHARVLWIGLLQGSEAMRRLASALEDALARHGFANAESEFEPHLTIGRLRASADMTQRLIASPMMDVRFQVDHVLLVNSTLSRTGPVYEPIASVKLLG